MAYKIVAEREDLTVRMEQDSILFAIAKARIFARDGWNIVVTDSDGQVLYPTVLPTLPARSERPDSRF